MIKYLFLGTLFADKPIYWENRDCLGFIGIVIYSDYIYNIHYAIMIFLNHRLIDDIFGNVNR